MKTIEIEIPASVEVGPGFYWSLPQCVQHVVDTTDVFNRTRDGMRAGDRIVNAIAGKEPGDTVSWLEADWKLLDRAFSEPGEGYCPPLVRDGNPFNVPARTFKSLVDALIQKE